MANTLSTKTQTKCVVCNTWHKIYPEDPGKRKYDKFIVSTLPVPGDSLGVWRSRHDEVKPRTFCYDCVNAARKQDDVTPEMVDAGLNWCRSGHSVFTPVLDSGRCVDCSHQTLRNDHRCSCGTSLNNSAIRWGDSGWVVTSPVDTQGRWTCSRCMIYKPCPTCFREGKKPCRNCDGSYIVHDWKYSRRTLNFLQSEKDFEADKYGLFFGMELEMRVSSENGRRNDTELRDNTAAAAMREVANNDEHHFHVMHDGTVMPGWEVVVQPMSYKYFMEENKPFWDMVEYCRKHYAKANDSYGSSGVHIHLSRSAFTRLHQIKFIQWVYANVQFMSHINNRPFLEEPSNFGCHPAPQFQYLPNMVRHGKVGRKNARYTLLNMENPQTLELRGFNSVTDASILRSYMQFCHALYHHTYDISLQDVDVDGFVEFVKRNVEIYPDLVSRIQSFPKAAFTGTLNVNDFRRPKGKKGGAKAVNPFNNPEIQQRIDELRSERVMTASEVINSEPPVAPVAWNPTTSVRTTARPVTTAARVTSTTDWARFEADLMDEDEE